MSLANNGALTDVGYRVKQDVRLTVSANPAEMPLLREDLSKMWNEPSLRRRRCSSVLQVDPSLAQQHNEEPRRPCSFSAHQQFTIRAATTTNSVLSKREDASVHQLIDSWLKKKQTYMRPWWAAWQGVMVTLDWYILLYRFLTPVYLQNSSAFYQMKQILTQLVALDDVTLRNYTLEPRQAAERHL